MTDGGGYDVKRCGKCAAWIPTSATMCAYCGTSSPDAPPERPKGSMLSIRHGVRVADALIAVNCAFLIFAAAAEYSRVRNGNPLQWILTATGFSQGLLHAGAYHHILVAEGQWWRVVSATFLHAGILHIGLNMFSLRNLGGFVEDLFGPAKFLVVYLLTGACSTLAVSVYYVWILKLPPERTPLLVGASGSVVGIAGFLIVYLFRAGNAQGRAIGRSLAINVAIMLFIGWQIPFVSNTAHIGGLLAGVACGLTIGDSFRTRLDPASRARWSKFAALCVALAVVALLWSAWFAVSHRGDI